MCNIFILSTVYRLRAQTSFNEDERTMIRRWGRLLTKPSIRNHTWIDGDLRAPFYRWMTYVWDTVGRFSTTIVVGSHFYVEIGESDNPYESTHTIVCANIPSIGNSHCANSSSILIDIYFMVPMVAWVHFWGWFWIRHIPSGLCDIMQKIEWNNEPKNSYQLPLPHSKQLIVMHDICWVIAGWVTKVIYKWGHILKV